MTRSEMRRRAEAAVMGTLRVEGTWGRMLREAQESSWGAEIVGALHTARIKAQEAVEAGNVVVDALDQWS